MQERNFEEEWKYSIESKANCRIVISYLQKLVVDQWTKDKTLEKELELKVDHSVEIGDKQVENIVGNIKKKS